MEIAQLFQGLNDSGTYTGPGEVKFEHPHGWVTGSAAIDVKGRPEITLEIGEFEIDPAYGTSPIALQAFLLGEPLKQAGTGVILTAHAETPDRRATSILVHSDAGVLSASSALLHPPVFLGLDDRKRISLVPNDLVFNCHAKVGARHWFLPLQGPFAEYFPSRGGPSHLMCVNGGAYFPFIADGRDCGFQIFEKGKGPQHPLQPYDAIVFGELRCKVNTADALWTELPVGLLQALSFAVGADVIAPWIETRTDTGDLVQRFFIRPGKAMTDDGFPAFTSLNEFQLNSVIGAFLAKFFACTQDNRQSLIAPLNLIRSGTPGKFHIEDSITDLVKALDNLCANHGFVTQSVMSRLNAANRLAVEQAIDAARAEILKLRTHDGSTPDEIEVLNSICGRISNSTNTTRNFGLAVRDLLSKLSLPDADILDQHFASTSPDETWAGLLSKVRGQVIHKGHMSISDRRELRNWFAFARHLHDLCKRIILAEVKYQGTYQPTTHNWHGEHPIDRVKPTMRIKDLGFEDVPTKV
jgi:hypothetical protein